jgi:hypothetical protein
LKRWRTHQNLHQILHWHLLPYLFDSYEWIANPNEVSPSPGPQQLKYINSPESNYIFVVAVPLNGHHTRVVTPTSNPSFFVPPKRTLFHTKDDILVPKNVKLLLSVFWLWCLLEHDQHQSTAFPRLHISTWENLTCTRRPSLIGIRMQQNYNGMSRTLRQILLSFLITHWVHEVIKWVSCWKLITLLLHNNPQYIVGFGYVTLKILQGSVPSITWWNRLLRQYCEPSTAPSTVSLQNGVGHRVLTWFAETIV